MLFDVTCGNLATCRELRRQAKLLCYVRIVQTIFCACLASLKRGALVCNTSGNLLIGMPRCRNVSFTYENEQKSDPEKKRETTTMRMENF